MNSKNLTPYHLTQLAILIIFFVVFLLLNAWVYQVYYLKFAGNSAPPATKEDIEKIYGATIQVSEEDKQTIESIYGN